MNQTPEEKKINNVKNKERMQNSRKRQTPEERINHLIKHKEIMQNSRKKQSQEQKIRKNVELKERMQNLRKKQIKSKTELDRLLAFKKQQDMDQFLSVVAVIRKCS